MSHYFFALMPEAQFGKKICKWRMDFIGSKFVDSLPPHLTVKRRFLLKKNISIDTLEKVLDGFSFPKIIAKNNKIKRLGETTIISIRNAKLKKYHKKLQGLLKNVVISKNPEFEDDHFTAHLTLFRDPENKLSPNWNSLDIKKIVFNKICLYEIDPSSKRCFAYKIKCKRLK